MDLNDKYEELSELVAGIEDLVNKIEDVTYIEQLNGIKGEVQAELDKVSEQLEEQQEDNAQEEQAKTTISNSTETKEVSMNEL